MTALRTLFVVAVAGLWAGCSDDTKCGAGTVEKNGACVLPPPVACGEGTYEDGGTCVPVTFDAGTPPTCEPACASDEVCESANVCVPAPVPSGWSCGPASYRDGVRCDCACGAPDPDCEIEGAPVNGCASGACKADGTCAPCTPSCSGKACGDDGCGGSCGQCFDPSKIFCIEGQCAACTPDCEGKSCGPDGCGGECGTCGSGTACELGKCVAPSPDASCSNRCGGMAPSGCSCQGGCELGGSCCVDVEVCGCLPSCGDRLCGDDGCGGSCGRCGVEELCVAGACRTNACTPDPCSGNGTCHLPDATCTCQTGFAGTNCTECAPGYTGYPNCIADLCAAAGNTCSGHGTCAPASGACTCNAGFSGVKCDACAPGRGTYPNCTP